MKRYLAILTLLSLCFTLGVNSSVLAALPETSAYPTTIWNYDFTTDDETTYLASFQKKYAVAPIIVDDPVPTGDRGKVAVYPRNGSSDNFAGPEYGLVSGKYSASELKHAKLTADVLLTDKFLVTLRIIDHNASGETAVNMNLVNFNNDGTMTFLNGPTLNYSANEWYSFVFYLDMSGAEPVYSAYLNGQLVCRYAEMTQGVHAVKTLRFQIAPNSSRASMNDAVYIDNWGYFTATQSIDIPEISDPEPEPDPEPIILPEKPIEPPVPVTQMEGDGYGYTVWETDFESDNVGDGANTAMFRVFPSPDVVAEKSEVVVDDEEHGNVLKLSGYSENRVAVRSNYDYMTQDFATGTADQLSQVKFTADIKLHGYVTSYIETLSYTTDGFHSFILFTKEGDINLRTYDSQGQLEFITVGQYELDEWYRLVCYADADTATFTLHINDQLVAKNLRYNASRINGFRAIGVSIESGEEVLEDDQILIDNLSISAVDRWMHNEATVFHDNFDGDYTEIVGLNTYPDNYYRMYGNSTQITDVPKYDENGVLIATADPERGKVIRLDTMHKDRVAPLENEGYFDTQYNVIRNNFPDENGKRLTRLKTSFDIMLEAGSRLMVGFHNYPSGFYPTIQFNENGNITFNGYNVLYNPAAREKYTTYEANTWYNVTIYVDVVDGTANYTVLINDEKIASGKMGSSDVNFLGIDNIRFSGSKGEQAKYVYIDNLKLDTTGSPLVKVTREYQEGAAIGGKVIYRLNPRLSAPVTILVSGRKDNEMTDVSFKSLDFSGILSSGGAFPYELSTGKEMKMYYWKDWTLQPMAQPTTITY